MAFDLKNFRRVNENLYRGARPTELDIEHLAKLGIRTIIDFNRRETKGERSACESHGLKYIHLPWTAFWWNGLLFGYYYKITLQFLEFMKDESLRPVYIHCFHGRDRTGMLIGAYRMYFEGWHHAKVIQEMKEFGFSVFRHWDIVRFLKRCEQKKLLSNP